MRIPICIMVILLGLSAAHADEAESLRKVYAERDLEMRKSIESLQNVVAEMRQRLASLKSGLGKEPETPLVIVEVRDDTLLAGGKPLSLEELAIRLKAITAVYTDASIQLVAAPGVSWERIQPALQVCHDAEMRAMEFLIKKPE